VWEPSAQEIQEKLIDLAYTWGDIEEEVYRLSEGDPESDWDVIRSALGIAFRVEAVFGRNGWNDPCTFYVLLYDVTDGNARGAANAVDQSIFRALIKTRAQPWHTDDYFMVRRVHRGTPVEGEICRRVGERHPSSSEPTLDDLPIEPPGGLVGLEKRDVYWLTPIEAKFYDAVRDTGLFFAVQPWIQGTDRRYRLDFLFFYEGGGVAVELDGHEWHKTKDQRGKDAERDRWFQERGIRTIRWTGTQVYADPQRCVSELLNVLRASQARP
jgi:very-short-patch-repair endonuclease